MDTVEEVQVVPLQTSKDGSAIDEVKMAKEDQSVKVNFIIYIDETYVLIYKSFRTLKTLLKQRLRTRPPHRQLEV